MPKTRKRNTKNKKRKTVKRNMKIDFKKKDTDTVLKSFQKEDNKLKKVRVIKDKRKYSDTNYPYRNNTKKEAIYSIRIR